MKKLLILALIAAGAFIFYKNHQAGGGPLDDLRQRLDAAEQSFQQAGRAAGASGMDTTAGAESARVEVEQVERALRDMTHTSLSPEAKKQVDQMLARASDLKRRMS